MYGHKLQVFDEHLNDNADLSATSTGAYAVRVGGVQGALVAYVIANNACVVGDGVTVSVLGSNEEKGAFNEIAVKDLPAGNYALGDVIAKISLPPDTSDDIADDLPLWAKATVTGAAGSSGNVNVTLGYLAR